MFWDLQSTTTFHPDIRKTRFASLPASCGNWPEWHDAELSLAKKGPLHFYEVPDDLMVPICLGTNILLWKNGPFTVHCQSNDWFLFLLVLTLLYSGCSVRFMGNGSECLQPFGQAAQQLVRKLPLWRRQLQQLVPERLLDLKIWPNHEWTKCSFCKAP